MEDESNLTKKERKALAKKRKKEAKEREKRLGKAKKLLPLLLVLVLIGYVVYWLINAATAPLPGQEVPDMGTNHIQDLSGYTYNSNPPTSGSHFPVWAKGGVYYRVLSDGHLIHSLEHGYVVISYDCTNLNTSSRVLVKEASAHTHPEGMEEDEVSDSESSDEIEPLMKMRVGLDGNMSFFTPDNPPPVEVELPMEFSSGECTELVDQLSQFTDEWERVIVVPRPNMDSLVALTAWTRIDKVDKFDEEKIEAFIRAFHNRGPEQTVE